MPRPFDIARLIVRRTPSVTAIYVAPKASAPPAALVARTLQVLVEEERFSVSVLPPGCGAAARFSSLDRLILGLDPKLFDPRLLTAGPQDACDPYLFGIADMLRRSFRNGMPPTERYLDSLVHDLAEHLRSNYPISTRRRHAQGLSPTRLARALALIEQHLDAPLPVADLAEAVHLSPFHFSRMFRRSTGCSPHDFVTRLRMEKARGLLAATNMPIAEIARAVGYRTQAHFTRAFHDGTGTTPRKFRLAQQPPPNP